MRVAIRAAAAAQSRRRLRRAGQDLRPVPLDRPLGECVLATDPDHERVDDAESAHRDERGIEDLIVPDDLSVGTWQDRTKSIRRRDRIRFAFDPELAAAFRHEMDRLHEVRERWKCLIAAVRRRGSRSHERLAVGSAERDHGQLPGCQELNDVDNPRAGLDVNQEGVARRIVLTGATDR